MVRRWSLVIAVAVALTACTGQQGGTGANGAQEPDGSPATGEASPAAQAELSPGTFVTSVTPKDAVAADVSEKELDDFPLDVEMTIDSDRLRLNCAPSGGKQKRCADYAYTSTSETVVLVEPELQVTLRLSWVQEGGRLTFELLDHSADDVAPDLVAYDRAIFESHPWTAAG
jgi:hypothetical protein